MESGSGALVGFNCLKVVNSLYGEKNPKTDFLSLFVGFLLIRWFFGYSLRELAMA